MESVNENARPSDELERAQGPQQEKTDGVAGFGCNDAARDSDRKPSFESEARPLLNAGLTLIPLDGKRPVDGRWQSRRYDSAAVAAAAEGRHNLGVRISGTDLLVIDADPRNYRKDDNSLDRLTADFGIKLEDYPVVRTGGGGIHVYMRRTAGTELAQALDGYPGIDLKTSGQVVAPGSIHPETGEPYVGERMELLALESLAPRALLDFADKARARQADGAASGVWTPEELAINLSRLDPDEFDSYGSWFEVMLSAHYATGGAGLDEFVEWSTRFTGADAASPEQIADKWRGLTVGAGRVTHRHICKLLHDRGERVHDEPAAEDDFDAVEMEELPASREERWRFLTMEELEALPPPRWLVPGIFVEEGIAAIYGAPESGKSFLAVDIAMSVASGIAWHGREVSQGAALYVAAEGAPGIGKRTRAWRIDRGDTARAVPFTLMRDPLNLTTEKEARDFARAASSVLGPLRLVVIDTLNQTAAGADENSAQEMGRYIAGMKRLRDATGASVVVVHHSGKDESKGMRGSTALLGAMDTTVEVVRSTDGGSIEVRVRKQKDAEREPPMRFNLEKVADSLVLRSTMMVDVAPDYSGGPIRAMARDLAVDGRVALKGLVAALRERDGVSDKTARRHIAEAIPEGRDFASESSGRLVWRERADGNPRGEMVVRVEEVPGCREP